MRSPRVPSIMTRWTRGFGLLGDSRRRVIALVVDSDPLSQRLFARSVEAQGFQPVIASAAAEGLEKFTCSAPSFVLLDVNSPVPAAVLIRQCAETEARIPVVVLTIAIDRQVPSEAVRSGATKLLEKGASTGALREAIDAVSSESSPALGLPVSESHPCA